ncbi:cation:proton antiporter [Thauera humireducens]|uniref:cation:proton antiporter n=1 Tax=Thauera humireducens TaxID=1134435 RepID=UPI00311FB3FD
MFGLVTFAIPQGLGMLVAYYVLGFAWPAAILLASMFASHTLLTYPIVSRLGLTRNLAVTTAVGGTIVTDTLALLVLAVIAGMTRGEVDENFAWQLGLSLTLYVAAILIGLPLLARWFFRRVARDGVAEFVFVLATVFGCAALSHVAGSEPIVGAFLGGWR